MSRRRSPPARSGRSNLTLGALIGLVVAAVGAVAAGGTGACSPEKWLDGVKIPGNEPSSPSKPSDKTSSRPAPTPTRGPAPQKPPNGERAQTIHLEMGAPTDKDPSDDLLLTKPQYALSYNTKRNVANWVSWNLNASYFGDVPRFKGKFLSDTSLPEGIYRVRHDDYVGSGYDRGHMVRSEERTATPDDNKSTFLMTNILPQYHDLNAGPWLKLEDYAQDLAQKEKKELFIMAGGVFGGKPETIGKDVAVPEACFKIIVVLEKGQGASDVDEATRVIAVLMPNVTGILDKDWGPYRTSIREIEKRTGYAFLPRVNAEAQSALKTKVDKGPTG